MMAPNFTSTTGSGEPSRVNRKVNRRCPLVLYAEPVWWVMRYLYSAGFVPNNGIWIVCAVQLAQYTSSTKTDALCSGCMGFAYCTTMRSSNVCGPFPAGRLKYSFVNHPIPSGHVTGTAWYLLIPVHPGAGSPMIFRSVTVRSLTML